MIEDTMSDTLFETVEIVPARLVLTGDISVLVLPFVTWKVDGLLKRTDELEPGDLIEFTSPTGDVTDETVDDVFLRVDEVDPDAVILIDQFEDNVIYERFVDLMENAEAPNDISGAVDSAMNESARVSTPEALAADASEEDAPAHVTEVEPVPSAGFAHMLIEPPTDAELTSIAAKMLTGKSTLRETFLAALMAEHVDEVVKRVRNRDAVMSLFNHMSTTTWWLTSAAARLNIDVDSAAVAPTRDFHEWSGDKTTRLLRALGAEMDRLSALGSRNDQQLIELGDMRGRITDLKEVIEKARSDAADAASRYSAASDDAKSKVLAANAELNQYHDLPELVVARVDPVTRKPVKYVRLEDDSIKLVRDWSAATKFESAQDARAARSRSIRAMRRSGKDYASASEAFAVVCISLREIAGEE